METQNFKRKDTTSLNVWLDEGRNGVPRISWLPNGSRKMVKDCIKLPHNGPGRIKDGLNPL